MNIATDLATTLLPMPVQSKLNLPTPQRRTSALVFAY